MGYSTSYKGKLVVNPDLPISALPRLKRILGGDVRDFPDLAKHRGTWRDADGNANSYWYHVDLVLDDDDMSLEWDDDTEKSFICGDMIHAIVAYMREEFPNFTLNGVLDAFGEEPGDVWQLKVVDGIATHCDPVEEAAKTKTAVAMLIEAAEAVIAADNNGALTDHLITKLLNAVNVAKSQ